MDEANRMNENDMIARCGFNCSRCRAYRGNVEGEAERQMASAYWSKYYLFNINAGDIFCDGCLVPDSESPRRVKQNCSISNCVRQKNLENCSHCEDYPCVLLEKQRAGSER